MLASRSKRAYVAMIKPQKPPPSATISAVSDHAILTVSLMLLIEATENVSRTRPHDVPDCWGWPPRGLKLRPVRDTMGHSGYMRMPKAAL
jgi:hypothetical protein